MRYLLFFALFPAHCFSQSALHSRINSLKTDTDLINASWSFIVINAKTDSVIAEHNANTSLVPASVMKIVTTATALALLGWDFRYETFLEHDGTLDTVSGILKGNIYIRGSGDPTLDSKTFRKKSDTIALTDQWAKIISSKGIKKIEGSVIADAGSFEEETVPFGWVWSDMGNYYGAGASGLNFKDNRFTLFFKSGLNNGNPTSITQISPDIPGLKIKNYVTTRGYSDLAWIYGAPYSLMRYVKGTIPKGKSNYQVSGSMPDPALFCAQSLDSSLRKAGIQIEKRASSIRKMIPAPEEFIFTNDSDSFEIIIPDEYLFSSETTNNAPRTILHTHKSHTLDKIAYETNLQSNNLFAEALLKTIAWKKTKFGEDQKGIDITVNYWKTKLSAEKSTRSRNTGLNGFYMTDGSGLSRFNAMSANQLATLLRLIALDSALFDKFYNTLPVAGKSGSLGKLCKGTFAENNLRAKSGYMTRVRSYAGYVHNRKGELLCFAVIVNNYNCTPAQMKEKLEKLMIAIAETQ